KRGQSGPARSAESGKREPSDRGAGTLRRSEAWPERPGAQRREREGSGRRIRIRGETGERRYDRRSRPPRLRARNEVGVYPVEQWSDDEEAILRPSFTNLDRPVFAVVNLPEVVKGALFARYSRSSKSLRRLFLDEFVADLDLTGDLTYDATVGL